MKISEKQLSEQFVMFLTTRELINSDSSYFLGDNDGRSDIEIDLKDADEWGSLRTKSLYIEAKTHHTKDSQNTINKIFGQLLKETGKRTLNSAYEAYAILIPSEAAQWVDKNNKRITKIDGASYYRRGFSRINLGVYVKFGALVNAKYILVFSETDKRLDVYGWADFINEDIGPLVTVR